MIEVKERPKAHTLQDFLEWAGGRGSGWVPIGVRRDGSLILPVSGGAVTLAESAKYSMNTLRRGIIETFVWESLVLDRIPLMDIEGNAYAYNEETTLPGVEFRAVNAAYAESTGVITQKTESLVILGGDADVDRFIVRTRSNINDVRAEQEVLKVKAAVAKFQDTFINGDVAVDANSFDGLKKRLTGAQVITAATNGLGPVAGGHTFLDQLDAAIAQVPGATDIYTRADIRQKIGSSGRRLGLVDLGSDALGRPLMRYNGLPLHDIGNKGDGTPILPLTEVEGTSSNATSIYVVKFGNGPEDRGVTGLTNGGIDVEDLGEMDSKPVFRTRLEFYCGLALFGGQAAARLKGVLNA